MEEKFTEVKRGTANLQAAFPLKGKERDEFMAEQVSCHVVSVRWTARGGSLASAESGVRSLIEH